MRETDLFQALRPWLMAATGIEVIEAHPSAPRPEGEYVEVNLIEAVKLAHAVTYLYEEDDTPESDGIKDLYQVPVIPFEWLYSINVYASDPVDKARQVVTWASCDAGAFHLHPLIAQPIERIRRLPVLIDGKWEGRAQFELAIRGYVKRGVITDGAGNEIQIGRVPIDEVLEGTITLGPTDRPGLVSGDYQKPEGD
ncbi:phage neck terminator protein [Shinella granuli]|uniref:Phage neck terminator protein gp12-like domain-containing protein n=1 Tax=Shinella granuli TaxID=323621 RepID=A0A4R2CMX3_SHIGR|nr:hypothetical protein [Shinella granuli]TCN41422.1 hypothetical protein EV665_1137 [Shinella granuli]